MAHETHISAHAGCHTVHDWTGAHHTVSVAPPAPIRLRPPDSAAEMAIDEEHGLDSVAEILGYLVSLVCCLRALVSLTCL